MLNATMNKLFYAPDTSSIGIHVILEEIGHPYDRLKVDFSIQQQRSPEFRAINSKGKVPVLVRDDGSVLTEFPAIAAWLALTNPEAALLPATIEAQARMFEIIDYVVSTIHMQGFARLFRPGNSAPNQSDHESVRARGREIVEDGFQLLNVGLERKEYLAESMSIADAALFYIEFWAHDRLQIAMPEN
jgi:glutathione S-transferase